MLYDQEFFDKQGDGSLASARIVLPILFEYFKPASIVDVGCGRGAWLRAAAELGVEDTFGIDGDYVRRESLFIEPEKFLALDLGQRIELPRKFDLAISVEVAEHLPVHRAEGFVEDLVNLSDTILFSAALPYQGGTEHINEQWLEFWAILFGRHGFVPCDPLRHQLWGISRVDFWYSQNLIVFCKADLAGRLFPPEALALGRPLSFPHPLTLLTNVGRYRPLAQGVFNTESEDYHAMLAAYLDGGTALPPMKMLDATQEVSGTRIRLFPRSRTLVLDVSEELRQRDEGVEQRDSKLRSCEATIDSLTARLAATGDEVRRLEQRALELESALVAITAAAPPTEGSSDEGEPGSISVRVATTESLPASSDGRRRLSRLPRYFRQTAKKALSVLTAPFSRVQEMQIVKNSGLLDAKWYIGHYPEVASFLMGPFWHYVLHGASQAYDPHPLFSSAFYLGSNAEVAERQVNPVVHYVRYGAAEGRNPHPLFSSRWYSDHYMGQNRSGINPLAHYILADVSDQYNPNPLFDSGWYLSQFPEGTRPKSNLLEHYVLEGARLGLTPHPLFHSAFYLERNSDVARAKMNPLEHYLRYGWRERRSPHPLFDAVYYLERYPDVARQGLDPLRHYIEHGARELRIPHPLFSPTFYLAQGAESLQTGETALGHFLRFGARNGRSPHPLFDVVSYLANNPDVAKARVNPLEHYVLHGGKEGRSPHPLFNPAHYEMTCSAVRAGNISPLQHYLTCGGAVKGSPHPFFDSDYYLTLNPDVAETGMSPLEHYLLHGAYEGRNPHTSFDSSYYLEQNPDVAEQKVNPLVHYVGPGIAEGRNPNPYFNTTQYLEEHPEVALGGRNPLLRFLSRPFQDVDLRSALRYEYGQSGGRSLNREIGVEPRVTVVIPCFNQGHFLEDAVLSSLLACSGPLEIIVVDDGSTDTQSIALVDELSARYGFQVVRQANTGLAGARNAGVSRAKGAFIQFLDADDLLAPGKIDIQLKEFDSDAAVDVCISDYDLSDGKGLNRWSYNPSTISGYSLSLDDFLFRWERGLSIPIHCGLFRRKAIKETPFRQVTNVGKEDWIFWVELASTAPKFKFNPGGLVTYRLHGKNMVSNHETMGLDFLRASLFIAEQCLGSHDSSFVEQCVRHFKSAYLGSIKHEAIQWDRTHSSIP